MPVWIIIAALLSVALTALLISVLMRVNQPPKGALRRDRGSDGGPVVMADSGSRSRNDDADTSSDGGGGDGGGD